MHLMKYEVEFKEDLHHLLHGHMFLMNMKLELNLP